MDSIKEILKLLHINFPHKSYWLVSVAMHFLTKLTSFTTISPKKKKKNHSKPNNTRQSPNPFVTLLEAFMAAGGCKNDCEEELSQAAGIGGHWGMHRMRPKKLWGLSQQNQ